MVARSLALALATAVGSAISVSAKFTPNLFFNFTVTDMNGMWWFYPSASMGLNDGKTGWNASYDGVASADFVPGMVGVGSSAHSTQRQIAATIRYMYVGKDIYVDGDFTAGTPSENVAPVQFRVDSNDYDRYANATVGETLAQSTGLGWGYHTADIEMFNEGGNNLSVSAMTITTGIQAQAKTIAKVPRITKLFVLENRPSRFFNFTGNWNVATWLNTPAGQPQLSHSSIQGSAGASLTIPVPAGTTFMVLNGTMGPEFFDYTLRVHPREPGREADDGARHVYPHSAWTVPNAVMYAAPLDPAVTYTVSVNADVGVNTTMGLNSVTFYSGLDGFGKIHNDMPDGGQAISSSLERTGGEPKPGVVAGAVVGSIVGALLLGAMLFACYIRRRRSKESMSSSDEEGADPFTGGAPRRSSEHRVVEKPRTSDSTREWVAAQRQSVSQGDWDPPDLPATRRGSSEGEETLEVGGDGDWVAEKAPLPEDVLGRAPEWEGRSLEGERAASLTIHGDGSGDARGKEL